MYSCASVLSAGIVSWIKKKAGPVTTNIDTVAALTEKEGSSPVLAVGFFKKLEVRCSCGGMRMLYCCRPWSVQQQAGLGDLV